MRYGSIIDVLISVDIQEIVKIGGKVVEISESFIYRESFKVSPFKKVLDKLFDYDKNIKMKIMMLCNC